MVVSAYTQNILKTVLFQVTLFTMVSDFPITDFFFILKHIFGIWYSETFFRKCRQNFSGSQYISYWSNIDGFVRNYPK